MNLVCEERFGVIWDMDGVLVDTGELHYQTWQEILPSYGIPFSRQRFRLTFGMNNQGFLEYMAGKPLDPAYVREIADRKESRFRELINGSIQPLPGVVDWLKRLGSQGVRQAVASSAPQANVDVLLAVLKIGDFFQAAISAAEMPGKPDPAVFLQAARLMDLPPASCVVVEDAIPGVEAARRGGMACIAVTTTNPPEALANADLVVNRLDELPGDAFQRLWANRV